MALPYDSIIEFADASARTGLTAGERAQAIFTGVLFLLAMAVGYTTLGIRAWRAFRGRGPLWLVRRSRGGIIKPMLGIQWNAMLVWVTCQTFGWTLYTYGTCYFLEYIPPNVGTGTAFAATYALGNLLVYSAGWIQALTVLYASLQSILVSHDSGKIRGSVNALRLLSRWPSTVAFVVYTPLVLFVPFIFISGIINAVSVHKLFVMSDAARAAVERLKLRSLADPAFVPSLGDSSALLSMANAAREQTIMIARAYAVTMGVISAFSTLLALLYVPPAFYILSTLRQSAEQMHSANQSSKARNVEIVVTSSSLDPAISPQFQESTVTVHHPAEHQRTPSLVSPISPRLTSPNLAGSQTSFNSPYTSPHPAQTSRTLAERAHTIFALRSRDALSQPRLPVQYYTLGSHAITVGILGLGVGAINGRGAWRLSNWEPLTVTEALFLPELPLGLSFTYQLWDVYNGLWWLAGFLALPWSIGFLAKAIIEGAGDRKRAEWKPKDTQTMLGKVWKAMDVDQDEDGRDRRADLDSELEMAEESPRTNAGEVEVSFDQVGVEGRGSVDKSRGRL